MSKCQVTLKIKTRKDYYLYNKNYIGLKTTVFLRQITRGVRLMS